MLMWVSRVSARSEDGASAVEYGLLLAGVASLIIAVVFVFGGAISDLFDGTCDSINTGSAGTSSAMTC